MPEKPGPDREATDERILSAIQSSFAPAVGTTEVAERIGVARQTADKHLRELSENGLVNTKTIGQVRIWWLSDEGRRVLDNQY